MRIHVLKHEVFEGPAQIAFWAKDRGHELKETLMGKDALPDHGSFEFLVVMGGSMSVNDESTLSWLKPEKQFILECIKNNKYVLGVCLGAQLISSCLGGRVTKNPEKEIGWFPVYLTEEGRASKIFRDVPEEFLAFHWHGETFEVPPGCGRTAYSDGCDDQAFVYGDRVLALQFHVETNQESAEEMLKSGADELTETKYVQSGSKITERPMRFDVINRILYKILDNLTGRA